MDYQRACGCRMGRGYTSPVYRSVQMSNARLNECASREAHCETPTPYGGTIAHSMQSGVRMGYDRTDHSGNCCGDPNQNYPSLAIVTSPGHVWQKLFSPCDAMAHGTLFCELYKPWVGCKMGGRMK